LDEIGLLARYVEIRIFGGRDYEGAYNDVKSALKKKGHSKWQKEIPSSLRTFYTLKGTKTRPVYKGDNQKLYKLLKRLSSYASGSHLRIEPLSDLDKLSSEELKVLIISLILNEEERAYYKNIPQNSLKQRAWLSRWYTLITDRLKLDYRANLEEKIKKVIEGRSLSIPFLEDRLINSGFRFVSISERKELFKADNELKNLIKRRKYSKLTEYFINKW
ncbi:unnamed protein product, partial [marine sediment metagenome]